MFVGYLFLRFKDRHEICQINPSQTLMNLQYKEGDVMLNLSCGKRSQSLVCLLAWLWQARMRKCIYVAVLFCTMLSTNLLFLMLGIFLENAIKKFEFKTSYLATSPFYTLILPL